MVKKSDPKHSIKNETITLSYKEVIHSINHLRIQEKKITPDSLKNEIKENSCKTYSNCSLLKPDFFSLLHDNFETLSCK